MWNTPLKWWIACCIPGSESIHWVHHWCYSSLHMFCRNVYGLHTLTHYLWKSVQLTGKVQFSPANSSWDPQLNLTGLLHLCHGRVVFRPSYPIINNTDIFSFGLPWGKNNPNGSNSTVTSIPSGLQWGRKMDEMNSDMDEMIKWTTREENFSPSKV